MPVEQLEPALNDKQLSKARWVFKNIGRSIKYSFLLVFKTIWFSLKHPRRTFITLLHVTALGLFAYWAITLFAISPSVFPFVPQITTMIIATVITAAFYLLIIGNWHGRRHSTDA